MLFVVVLAGPEAGPVSGAWMEFVVSLPLLVVSELDHWSPLGLEP